MLEGARYYWMIAKGYRLRPWESPYVRWRLETFFGAEVSDLSGWGFAALLWRERARLKRFVRWAAERRETQRRAR